MKNNLTKRLLALCLAMLLLMVAASCGKEQNNASGGEGVHLQDEGQPQNQQTSAADAQAC